MQIYFQLFFKISFYSNHPCLYHSFIIHLLVSCIVISFQTGLFGAKPGTGFGTTSTTTTNSFSFGNTNNMSGGLFGQKPAAPAFGTNTGFGTQTSGFGEFIFFSLNKFCFCEIFCQIDIKISRFLLFFNQFKMFFFFSASTFINLKIFNIFLSLEILFFITCEMGISVIKN